MATSVRQVFLDTLLAVCRQARKLNAVASSGMAPPRNCSRRTSSAGCTKAKKASSRQKTGVNTASRSVSASRLLMSSGNRTDLGSGG